MYLAILPKGELAQLGDIAADYEISRNHLVKVVHKLGQLGFIITQRGKGGGIRLAETASKINIGEVVSKLENILTSIDCTALNCKLLPACALNRILHQAMKAYIDTLKNYTLADLVANRNTRELLETIHDRTPSNS
jgi:Rrf2 family nitric oxide-sensitive transcriptional repressor